MTLFKRSVLSSLAKRWCNTTCRRANVQAEGRVTFHELPEQDSAHSNKVSEL